MLTIDTLSYLFRALSLIREQFSILSVIIWIKAVLLHSCCICLLTVFDVSTCLFKKFILRTAVLKMNFWQEILRMHPVKLWKQPSCPMSYVCLICRMNRGILALNLKVNKKVSTLNTCLRYSGCTELSCCALSLHQEQGALSGEAFQASPADAGHAGAALDHLCVCAGDRRGTSEGWNTRHNIVDMNCCVKTTALSSFLDKSLVWWMMLRCADRLHARVTEHQVLLFPWAQDSFARLNYKYMNFHGRKPDSMSASNSFIMMVQGLSTGKGWKNGRGGNKIWGRKWFSVDGLSSEVRLNWTEVNNGCFVKARSSHSGSNKNSQKY